MSGEFRFGIEEEYFVNDAAKRDAARARTHEFFAQCRKNFPHDIHREMLEPQVEVAIPPCFDFAEARRHLASCASRWATWRGRMISPSWRRARIRWRSGPRVRPTAGQPRYGKVMHDLQMIGSRTVVCGMHVHVEVPDLAQRVDIMNRMQPYLPSCSRSPHPRRSGRPSGPAFWATGSPPTGSCRARGFPDLFDGVADYQRYIDTLVAARAIESSNYVWWVIRPSLKHPTLELRVADSCTRLDDTIAIAALYRCLVRHLSLNSKLNAGQTGASRAINDENGWRAQRYGIHGSFVDEASRSAKPVGQVLDEVLDLVGDDARELGCERELDLCRWILARGTSADQQLTLYTEGLGRGLSNRDALAGVVDWLSAETTGNPLVKH